jgi:uncharacterized membrane protein
MTNQFAAKAVVVCAHTFAGLVIMASGSLAPGNLLFGVRVPEGFRTSDEGRRAITAFRTMVGIPWMLSLLAVLLVPGPWLTRILILTPMPMIAAAVIGYFVEHHRLQRFAVERGPVREIEVSLEPDRIPWFMWLWPGPLMLLGAAALYLNANWDRIPDRFPVHWGIDGQPNGWSTRSIPGVYGGLMFGAETVLLLLVMALATWFGARRSSLRRPLTGFMIVVSYALAGMLSMFSLGRLSGRPMMAGLLPMLLIPIGAFYLVRKFNQPRDPPDPTPDECWKGGVFYFNRSDPALMVEKHTGMGLTVNFGNPWSWVLTGFLLLNVTSVFFLRLFFQ